MSKNYEGGRINTEWQQKIKWAIFDVEIDHVYFRKLNSRNWPVLKHRIKNYCDRIRLSRCEESEDSDDYESEEEEEEEEEEDEKEYERNKLIYRTGRTW